MRFLGTPSAFNGSEENLHHLIALLHHGRTRLVSVEGPPGSGKTTLVHSFVDWTGETNYTFTSLHRRYSDSLGTAAAEQEVRELFEWYMHDPHSYLDGASYATFDDVRNGDMPQVLDLIAHYSHLRFILISRETLSLPQGSARVVLGGLSQTASVEFVAES